MDVADSADSRIAKAASFGDGCVITLKASLGYLFDSGTRSVMVPIESID